MIRNGMIAALQTAASSAGLTIVPANWSINDYKLLILDTVASVCGIEEQLWDAYSDDIDRKVALAAPETGLWWQNQMINIFQFNSANPQVVNLLSDFSIGYPNPNDSYKIIKYCSVNFISYGRIQLKVAAQVSRLPADVDTVYGAGTLDTVQSFANTISDTTIVKVVQSGLADRIMIAADIYFNGLYAAVISTKVKAAINLYFSTKSVSNPTGIPFDGNFDITDLSRVIKSVEGVISFNLKNLNVRANATAFTPGTYNMIQGSDMIYPTPYIGLFAGYCVTEDTVGYTIDDTLNFIPR